MTKRIKEHIEQRYINLLSIALQEFYAKDAEALFKDKIIDERAMVGCVYRYMWYFLQKEEWGGLEHDIDIEYDRMNNGQGESIKKTIEHIKDHENYCKHGYDSCGKVLEKHNTTTQECRECKDRQFRPDIIVHHRMSELGEGNGLVVEFKKERKNQDLDVAKVMFCTCDKGDLKYKIGACVKLFERHCIVSVFKGGENTSSFSIDVNGIFDTKDLRYRYSGEDNR